MPETNELRVVVRLVFRLRLPALAVQVGHVVAVPGLSPERRGRGRGRGPGVRRWAEKDVRVGGAGADW